MIDFMDNMGIGRNVLSIARTAEEKIQNRFNEIDQNALLCQVKVLSAFKNQRVSDVHFVPCYGYGYDDAGRDTLDKVYSEVFGAQAALVRPNFISGTHALAVMLFSVLRPGDILLSATGKPYDTLEGVIGAGGAKSGSLADFGVGYKEAGLKNGKPDLEEIKKLLLENNNIKAVLIQRSKGYDWRESIGIDGMEQLISYIKSIKDVIVMADNCYGEFVQDREPTAVGADLMAGSLIKNPGGGLAPSGGYIAGKAEYVEMAADRLAAPGIGLECGANLGLVKPLYQGFFMAPHIVAQALKTAVFCGALMEEMGFEVCPLPNETRSDIIQAVKLGSPELIKAFCGGIQGASPVDSFVTPEPWEMPGYESQVIMAAGAFVQGASIEISADAPIRPPYVCYMQGGLTYESGKIAVMSAAQKVLNAQRSG